MPVYIFWNKRRVLLNTIFLINIVCKFSISISSDIWAGRFLIVFTMQKNWISAKCFMKVTVRNIELEWSKTCKLKIQKIIIKDWC